MAALDGQHLIHDAIHVALAAVRGQVVGFVAGAPDAEARLRVLEAGTHGLPTGDLKLAAADVLVQRNIEPVDQVGPVALDEPGHVFAEVLAGLGDEVAQPLQHLVAHPVPVWHAALSGNLADEGVQVFPGALEAQVECHVVDAGAEVVDLLQWNTDVIGKLASRSLDAVAETHSFDRAGAADGPAIHGHGVDVLQKRHVGAQRFHVAAHLQQHGDGAQAAHDAADAQRVGDGLAQPVALGYFEVDHGGRLVAADLDHADGVVCAVQCRAPVGGRLDGRGCLQRLGDLARHDLGGVQPLRVDVEQADRGAGQFGEAEDVAQQVLGKHRTAGADEGDFWHG